MVYRLTFSVNSGGGRIVTVTYKLTKWSSVDSAAIYQYYSDGIIIEAAPSLAFSETTLSTENLFIEFSYTLS